MLDEIRVSRKRIPHVERSDSVIGSSGSALAVWRDGRVRRRRVRHAIIDEPAHYDLGLTVSARANYLRLKRLFDVSVVVCAAPVWLPVLAVCMLVVALFDGLPVVFSQRRVGMRGVPFVMYKLRTMRTDAESAGAAFAGDRDPRITRLGALLRRTRLDELPQLWNVLRGEMSIVGPRPEQESFVKEFVKTIPGYHLRHSVRPGLTGLAQVTQGYVADAEGTEVKLRHDLAYVANVSPTMDARILASTVSVVVTGWGSR